MLLRLVVSFQWQSPKRTNFGLMIIVALAGTVGQLALIRAFSEGEVAMLGLYSYSGLAFTAF
jgi:drug/metabolite transporter (DMT)-like permease